PYEAYVAGDLDADGDTDEIDFLAFKQAFIADNPAGAAAAGFAIPEPAAWMLGVAAAAILVIWSKNMHPVKPLLALAAAAFIAAGAQTAAAAVTPVFFYDASVLPAGSIAVDASIPDLSGAGHNGFVKHWGISTSSDVP